MAVNVRRSRRRRPTQRQPHRKRIRLQQRTPRRLVGVQRRRIPLRRIPLRRIRRQPQQKRIGLRRRISRRPVGMRRRQRIPLRRLRRRIVRPRRLRRRRPLVTHIVRRWVPRHRYRPRVLWIRDLPTSQPIVRGTHSYSPRLRIYHAAAQAALHQQGLLDGIWRDRLATGDHELVRFINRFHAVPGFHHLVRDYMASPYQRRAARLAMRLAHRLASRDTRYASSMRFARSLGLLPDGTTVPSITVVHQELHYLLQPHPRLEQPHLVAQLGHSSILYPNPATVRWVFDGRALAMDRRQVVNRIWHALRRNAPGHWLANLPRLIVVI